MKRQGNVVFNRGSIFELSSRCNIFVIIFPFYLLIS